MGRVLLAVEVTPNNSLAVCRPVPSFRWFPLVAVRAAGATFLLSDAPATDR
jgi:hypothetical protein